MRAILALVPLLAAALAGCSDAPPSGTLTPAGPAFAVQGDAAIQYQEAVYPAGQVPGVGTMLCGPAQAPPQTQCVPPSSTFRVHFMALPQPEGQYEAVLAGGAGGELPLGALAADAANMWDLNVTLDEDLSGRFERLELRMGSLVLASAPAGEGSQTFAVAESLGAITATGTYSGRVLNVTVSGLPANATYSGYLYTADPTSGELVRGEPFTVRNGANEHTAERDVATYAEFHIHVGSSMVNLYKATLGGQA